MFLVLCYWCLFSSFHHLSSLLSISIIPSISPPPRVLACLTPFTSPTKLFPHFTGPTIITFVNILPLRGGKGGGERIHKLRGLEEIRYWGVGEGRRERKKKNEQGVMRGMRWREKVHTKGDTKEYEEHTEQMLIHWSLQVCLFMLC